MLAGGPSGSPNTEATDDYCIPTLEEGPLFRQDWTFERYSKMFWERVVSAAFRWPNAT